LPELPEVETVVRTLAPLVAGRRIVEARYLSALAAAGSPDEMAARISGQKILALRRAGKHLLFDLSEGVLDVHLRMTGKLLISPEATRFARAVFTLDDGKLMVFDDTRQFGRVLWHPSAPREVAELGPDPLELTPREFAGILRGRRGRIKPLLLNQRIVAGLGNIYADESLARARVHPLASAARLSGARLERLHAAIIEVLTEAIAAGGSSISDYVDAEGRRGGFQDRHRVYGREGEACLECGAAIRRIVVAQRGTHFCPRCQRA
jgi:formamidopyrimidine-DNA glycosylase